MYIDVDADSPGLKDLIKSGLLKRLRQFSEVEIEEENGRAFYSIFIQVLEFSPFGHRAYVLSVVYTERSLSFELLSAMYYNHFAKSEEEKKDAKKFGRESFLTRVYMGHSLHSCAEAELGQTLDRIVAGIDSNIIEPERQHSQSVKNRGRRAKKGRDLSVALSLCQLIQHTSSTA